jgi:hypothetical protein
MKRTRRFRSHIAAIRFINLMKYYGVAVRIIKNTATATTVEWVDDRNHPPTNQNY